MVEINVNFVLFEELEEKPNANGVQTRIVIIRENEGLDSGLDDDPADLDLPE